jgi:hypothetical protein
LSRTLFLGTIQRLPIALGRKVFPGKKRECEAMKRSAVFVSFVLFLFLLTGMPVLGQSYKKGLDAAKRQDYTSAMSILRPLAEQGHSGAQYHVGLFFHQGRGVPTSFKAAIHWYRLAAKQQNAKAQNNIATMYKKGQGVKRSLVEAARWYRMAAPHNDMAKNQLGVMHRYGLGNQKKSNATAFRLFSEAAANGHAKSIYDLGALHAKGRGTKKNLAKAVSLFRKAADLKYTRAQYRMGIAHEKGRGVEKDYKEAVRWYKIAAERKYRGAMYALARMFQRGRGTKKNYSKAIQWFRLANQLKHPSAPYQIARMYEAGQGVLKDRAQAIRWYRLALQRRKNPDARRRLSALTGGAEGQKPKRSRRTN